VQQQQQQPPALESPKSPAAESSADSSARSPQEPHQFPAAPDKPAEAAIPNPIYHPGVTESLHLSGTFEGKKTLTVSGTITLIVTKETSHGKQVNVMNSVLELHLPDGKRHQLQSKAIYGTEHDGTLKLLHKDSGSEVRWVESNTCPREPQDFIEGHTDGCEVHYDDGSSEKSTSTVTRDGDYLKVTWIEESTDAKGEHNSSEAYWFDISTKHIVRYSGSVSLADGSQMTLKGS